MVQINDIWMFGCNIDRNADGVTFNDMYTKDGNLVIVQGYDCLKQMGAQALWLWFGEWVMFNKIGVTYRRLLGQTGNKAALLQNQINKALYSLNDYIPTEFLPKYGIKKIIINSYDLNRSTKQLSVAVDIVLNSNKKVQLIV